MSNIIKLLAIITLSLSFAFPVVAEQVKEDKADVNVLRKLEKENEGKIKVLEERIKGNNEKTNLQIEALKDKLALRAEILEKRMNLYIGFAGLLLLIISFLGYKTISKWIKQTIEDKTNEEVEKYIITGEKLLKERGENAVKTLLSELQIKGKETLSGLENLKTEYVNALNNLKREDIDINKPLPDNTAKNLEKFAGKLIQTKVEEKYSADDWFYKGLAEYKKEEYDKAITSLTKAIELDPKNARAYSNRGVVYGNLKEYEKAMEDYNKAIELDPKSTRAYNNRGVVYSRLKEYKKAIENHNKAIELDPKNAVAYSNRGVVYSRLKEYKKAIEDHNKAIELDPKNTVAYDNRGFVYGRLKEYKKAIEDHNKAIELDPKNAVAYNNRGLVYVNLKEYKKAIEDYNKAIELDPKEVGVYQNFSEIYIIIGSYKNALGIIKKALSLSSDTKDKAICLYLKCILKKLLDMDTSVSETELNIILKEEFVLTWNFDEIELWLKDANIPNEAKTFISVKTELLKKHNGL